MHLHQSLHDPCIDSLLLKDNDKVDEVMSSGVSIDLHAVIMTSCEGDAISCDGDVISRDSDVMSCDDHEGSPTRFPTHSDNVCNVDM